jgi:formylglycine-generating enzyme required for sulfatase activity
VTIARPFALGRYEITFEEWDACVADGGCGGHRPGDEGWGRGRRPVINISWEDARAYVRWLSVETGATYRLPSEAEWEYAARAGTTTPFWWGSQITAAQANFGNARGRTVPVDQPGFISNRLGLYHVYGNVWEWVEDCLHDSYAGAPSDGRSKIEKDCPLRVVRGGSWVNVPWFLRAANRDGYAPWTRSSVTGVRVARMLSP